MLSVRLMYCKPIDLFRLSPEMNAYLADLT
jgi:hypothetical protein